MRDDIWFVLAGIFYVGIATLLAIYFGEAVVGAYIVSSTLVGAGYILRRS